MAETAESTDTETATESFAEATLGKGFIEQPWLKRLSSLPREWSVFWLVAALGALLYIPYLGAVGLWDPWETHYGEVARSMIERRDYVHPFWENAWFFSKPAFTMWMMAAGMLVVGTNDTSGELARYTEWGFRMPFALFSILALALLSMAVARVVNRRAGLATGLVLGTMPMYFLLTRQAVTDTPFVSALVCAMACALIGQLDESTTRRSAWWYGFWASLSIGFLSKGLLGPGLPLVVVALYLLLVLGPWSVASLDRHLRQLPHVLLIALRTLLRRPVAGWETRIDRGEPLAPLWAQAFRMKLGSGLALFGLTGFPWFIWMSLFRGVDDESRRFFDRFFIHDHFSRLSAGVHTTTPGGTFTYFIEQGGFGIFPWVALVPGVLAVIGKLRLSSRSRADHLALIATLWLVFSFGLIGSSATKFHHYLFPMLPPLAILIGLFIDRLWVEGPGRYATSLLFGVPLFALVGKDLASNPKNFTDLFVYNYDRPYPTMLVQNPLSLFNWRVLWLGDLVTVALLLAGLYLVLDAFTNPSSTTAVGKKLWGALAALLGAGMFVAMASRMTVSPTLCVGVALCLFAGVGAALAFRDGRAARPLLFVLSGLCLFGGLGLAGMGASLPSFRDPLYATLTTVVNVKVAMGFAFTVAGLLGFGAAIVRGSRAVSFSTGFALALGFAVWFNWNHWVELSHHWTQRDLFWAYFRQRQPSEPITAFLMNWRGETFYSRNRVKQIKDNGLMAAYAAQPGREWALVEHNRLNILRGAVGPERVVTPVKADINNKFVLVTID